MQSLFGKSWSLRKFNRPECCTTSSTLSTHSGDDNEHSKVILETENNIEQQLTLVDNEVLNAKTKQSKFRSGKNGVHSKEGKIPLTELTHHTKGLNKRQKSKVKNLKVWKPPSMNEKDCPRSQLGDKQLNLGLKEEKAGNISFALTYFAQAQRSYNDELSLPSSSHRKSKKYISRQKLLRRKIIDATLKEADMYVTLSQTKEADECYKKAIEICERKYCDGALIYPKPFSIYGNFLSICIQQHQSAIIFLMKALKQQYLVSNKVQDVHCALILENIGHVYMRRSKSLFLPKNYRIDDENECSMCHLNKCSQEDAKRAETCFRQALMIVTDEGKEQEFDTNQHDLFFFNELKSSLHHHLSRARDYQRVLEEKGEDAKRQKERIERELEEERKNERTAFYPDHQRDLDQQQEYDKNALDVQLSNNHNCQMEQTKEASIEDEMKQIKGSFHNHKSYRNPVTRGTKNSQGGGKSNYRITKIKGSSNNKKLDRKPEARGIVNGQGRGNGSHRDRQIKGSSHNHKVDRKPQAKGLILNGQGKGNNNHRDKRALCENGMNIGCSSDSLSNYYLEEGVEEDIDSFFSRIDDCLLVGSMDHPR